MKWVKWLVFLGEVGFEIDIVIFELVCEITSLCSAWKTQTLVWFLVRPTYRTYVFIRKYNILPKSRTYVLIYSVLKNPVLKIEHLFVFYGVKIYRKNIEKVLMLNE